VYVEGPKKSGGLCSDPLELGSMEGNTPLPIVGCHAEFGCSRLNDMSVIRGAKH